MTQNFKTAGVGHLFGHSLFVHNSQLQKKKKLAKKPLHKPWGKYKMREKYAS